jgi:predicted LPLAT superfamily acyltransferase
MKKYKVEEIAALLEKAAAEIEMKDARIKELEAKLNEQTNSIEDFTKTAGFEGFNFGDEPETNWGLGEPSNVRTPSVDAKKKLEDFLNSLA